MAKPPSDAQPGLPWPESYADLQAPLVERWGVEGEIYLVRKLSGGRSGALVYAADLNSRDFGGQAILKLDEAPQSESEDNHESTRHQLALQGAPDFAATHLPRIVNAYAHDHRLALLSTIAGRGLEYAEPWSKCTYNDQLVTAGNLSREILEDLNRDYRVAEGLRTPQELLRGWLGYRLDPDRGRIHEFIKTTYGLTSNQPSFVFDGVWFPNPLAFVDEMATLPEHLKLRAITGNIHGDLHGYNVLVTHLPDRELSYYLIDLAMFEAGQFLFYDHAYFELSHMMRSRGGATPSNWLSILDSVGRHGEGGAVRQGDDLGLIQLVAAVRRALFDWIDRHEGNRLSHMECQVLLARIAAGLCFTHRQLSTESRSVAFLYAARSLKDLLAHNDIDWPKYGLPITIAEDPADAANWGSSAPASETWGQAGPKPSPGSVEGSARNDEAASPGPPGKLAIAVMAFENLGGDSEQDYFAEGVTEDLITDLTHIDWLTAISHESTRAYRGHSADPRRIGRDLDVNYVVHGSVRKAGDTVRVTVHLVDARSGREIWSERFDRKLQDLFAVQDEISASIVANIDAEAKVSERELAAHKRGSLNVWEMYQRAVWHFFRMTPEDDKRAFEEIHRAVRAVPGFAEARAMLSLLDARRFISGLSDDPAKDLERAWENARQSIDLDGNSALARMAYAAALALQGNHDAAIAEAESACQLNPSSANAHVVLGAVLYWAGRSAAALAAVERASGISMRDRLQFALKAIQALSSADLGNLAEAEVFARQAERANPRAVLGRLALAAILVRAGRVDEAGIPIAELRRLYPDYGLDQVAVTFSSMEAAQRDRFLDDLRKVGLAEQE